MTTKIVLLLAGAVSSSIAADALVNGGFEQPTLSPWTRTGGNATIANNAFAGAQSVALSFTSPFSSDSVTLSQSFTTSVSDLYTVRYAAQRFESSGGQNDVPLTFEARIDSTPITTTLPSFAGSGFQPGSWTTYETTISLPAGNHVFEFAATRGDSGFGRSVTFLVDDATVTAVPEPSTIALIVAGAVLLGRRRKTAPTNK